MRSDQKIIDQTTNDPAVTQEQIVHRLRKYLRQLDTHQRKREAATLISEAADEIERLQTACNKWSESETLNKL